MGQRDYAVGSCGSEEVGGRDGRRCARADVEDEQRGDRVCCVDGAFDSRGSWGGRRYAYSAGRMLICEQRRQHLRDDSDLDPMAA